MDIAFVSTPGRRIEDCRVSPSRNDSADLKKNGMTQRQMAYGGIPPKNDAEFVACMEEVLDVYERPDEANHPVIGMDEQPMQRVKETRQPIEVGT